MRAYALLRHPAALEASYLASDFARESAGALSRLRKALSFDRYAAYRGIERCAFSEEYQQWPPWERGSAPDKDDEAAARRLLKRFLVAEADIETPWPRTYVSRCGQAAEVMKALKRPQIYEIVELCTPPDRPARLLGYDVGYWGGEDFSILCDAAIWPVWHPPLEEVCCTLARFVQGLNDVALFPDEASARNYKAWYSGQKWAETDPEDFAIIAVGETRFSRKIR